MSFLPLISLSISIVNLLIAAFVFIRNPQHIVNRSFFIFVAGGTIWSTSIVIPLITGRFLSANTILDGGVLMTLGLVMLASTFPRFKPQKLFWLSLIPFVLLFLCIHLRLVIKSAAISSTGTLIPENGPLFPLFAIFIGLYIAASLFLFVRNYLRTNSTERLQMRYFLTGAAIFISAVFIFNIVLPGFHIFTLNLLGPMASIVFVGFTGYAIVKHRLLDIRLVIFRTVSFLLFLILCAVAYTAILFFIIQTIDPFRISVPLFIGMFIFTVIGMLTFQPLQTITRKITKHLFFQNQYDSDELILRLTRILSTTIDLDEMTKGILEMLTKEIKADKAAFLIVDDNKVVGTKSIGYADYTPGSLALERLLHERLEFNQLWLYDEMEDSDLKTTFRKLDIAIAIPIKVESREVAILILDKKSSGEIYYAQDINLLRVLASEAGVAIQNAEAYRKIKQFNEELEKKVEERTKDIARLKDEFIFIAVHELRTPVAIMNGFVNLAFGAMKNDPIAIQAYLKSISGASKQLNQLIDDILEIARSESASVKIEVEPANIIPLLESLVVQFLPIAAERHMHLELVRSESLPSVLINEEKLKEVISNLVSNAIKYGKDDGKVILRVSLQDGQVILACEDDGYGIPKDEQGKIFQKFFRAQSKETQGVKGTGLGLFITRMLVEKMGGTIDFVSKEGIGTTFTITFAKK